MPCKLRPLILPQLVEAQARQSSLSSDYDIESPELSASLRTQNSSASDFPSPPTSPSFSARPRQSPGSGSSIDAMHLNGPSKTSPCHDRFDSFGSVKCYLPNVEEETLEVNNEDEQYDLFSSPLQYEDCSCHDCEGQLGNDAARSFIVVPSTIEYDLTDSFWSDGDFSSSPQAKKRRADGSPFASIATRLSNKLPSLPKRWRSRKSSGQAFTTDDLREANSAYANDSRSPSSVGSISQPSDRHYGIEMPPSPARSVLDEEEENCRLSPVDIQKASKSPLSSDGIATTPLLPPLTIPGSNTPLESPIQSPLQSPTVAEPRESFSIVNTPTNTPTSPRTMECSTVGQPLTPPLSTHASISSFHRHRPGHLVPSNEIPPIIIGDCYDPWADRLGHANFKIQPEPYLPEVFDLAACKQIRANWDLARCNFAKHLVRTGEHYGITSKTYRLTEEKWAEIDSRWRRYDETVISKTAEESGVNATILSEAAAAPVALMKIPSLNDPRSEGKFPKLGDEDIVGPMVQFASQLQRKPSKKATFLKFLQDVKFPSGVMRASPNDDRAGP
ncbi:MAG: hypothetical protein M1839_006500 [Geoglossum umbratile]|nr:MAG: hypothetical protein M1839_006500 [Geoglossum umbratile]